MVASWVSTYLCPFKGINSSGRRENASEKAVQKKEEKEIGCRDDGGECEDSECSSSLREFLMLEGLCGEYEET
nr:hypothetical transcript [Hymenolepis microstoma]